ncbi:MAG: hypothetical protein KIT45_00500 [Fimbriimonadia bacterium]|nr:hypothetical protein [Fimbriimonadia bacterium]
MRQTKVVRDGAKVLASYPVNALSLIEFLLPDCQQREKITPEAQDAYFVAWPPNLFAFTSMFFQMTGVDSLVTELGYSIQRHQETWEYNNDVQRKFIDWINKSINEYNLFDDQRVTTSPLAEVQSDVLELAEIHNDLVRSAYKQWMQGFSTLGYEIHESFLFFDDESQRNWMLSYDKTPILIKEAWKAVRNEMDSARKGNIFDIWGKHKHLFFFMLFLHATADQMCRGWGIRSQESMGVDEFPLNADMFARQRLSSVDQEKYADSEQGFFHVGTMSTFHPDRIRILPKRHTPQVGVSLRANSLNLAATRSSVKVKWWTDGHSLVNSSSYSYKEKKLVKDMSFPILLLPWPMVVHGRYFKGSEVKKLPNVKEQIGKFYYDPEKDEVIRGFEQTLREVIKRASEEAGVPRLIVMPELSMNERELGNFEHVLLDQIVGSGDTDPKNRQIAYIVGVRREEHMHNGTNGKHVNEVVLGYLNKDSENGKPPQFERRHQRKHHRWKLDGWQIRSYQLGAMLHPEVTWWEDTIIERREVNFVNFGDELTLCPLVCEDLARQDPIAEVIRSVGPSLVVSILMDGPQLKSRWSARYASVLAEDPGSSVISLTSYGMVKRYRISDTNVPPPVIGLWSDRSGQAVEIVMDEGALGVVLSLAIESHNEMTLDERFEEVGTYTLTLGGIHSIKI